MICDAVGIALPCNVHPAVRATSSVQVEDLCGGVVLAVLDQEIAELRFELHPRVFFEDFLENLRRHLIKAQTQKVETGAEMDQCYLARQPGRYSRRGVQAIAFQTRSARSGDT